MHDGLVVKVATQVLFRSNRNNQNNSVKSQVYSQIMCEKSQLAFATEYSLDLSLATLLPQRGKLCNTARLSQDVITDYVVKWRNRRRAAHSESLARAHVE